MSNSYIDTNFDRLIKNSGMCSVRLRDGMDGKTNWMNITKYQVEAIQSILNGTARVVSKDIGTYNKNTQIADIWSIEDIRTLRSDIKDKDAMKILTAVDENLDANEGITWSVLITELDKFDACLAKKGKE